MSLEEDPKEVARKERQTPEVEKLLKQFLQTDGPKGNSRAFRSNWERTFEKCGECRVPFEENRCPQCKKEVEL